MTEIPAKLFQESHIVSVTFPEGVTSIGADAFRDCPNLKTINLLFVQVA